MHIAIVTEWFFPQVNGVTSTVRHTVDRLRREDARVPFGHHPPLTSVGD
jgi:hypothetical protein